MNIEDSLSEALVKTYQKSDVIFRQGSPGEEMYIIYKGKVCLYTEGKSGQKELLASLEAGDFFGEMALVDDSPRSATGIAEVDNTQVLVLDKKKFTYLVRNQPDFALVVMSKLCQNLRDTTLSLQQYEKEHHGKT
jgi:CRP-like cAMP-binding protein